MHFSEVIKLQFGGKCHTSLCIFLKGDFHDMAVSHATSLRQAYDTNCFV